MSFSAEQMKLDSHMELANRLTALDRSFVRVRLRFRQRDPEVRRWASDASVLDLERLSLDLHRFCTC